MKKSIFPINIYKKKDSGAPARESSHKDISRTLQTIISSQKVGARQNPKFEGKNPSSIVAPLKSPARFQRVVVSPKQSGPNSLQNPLAAEHDDYYGHYGNLRRFDVEAAMLNQRRERMVTAHPGTSQDVEFGGNEQVVPWCCLAKEARSRSVTDRMMLVSLQG
jgi:hypothetical protein